MKAKYIIGLLLLAAGLITIITTNIPAQGNPNQPIRQHIAVLISDEDSYYRDSNGSYIQTGRQIHWIDASPGAPVLERGTSLSAAIAYYANLGCTHEMISARLHLFKTTR